jgi:hypothetical protein
LNAEKHREKTTTDGPQQPDESIRTTNDGELNAESIRTKNDRELNAETHKEKATTDEPEQHAERIRMTNHGEFNAEQNQRLTAGSKASDLPTVQTSSKLRFHRGSMDPILRLRIPVLTVSRVNGSDFTHLGSSVFIAIINRRYVDMSTWLRLPILRWSSCGLNVSTCLLESVGH